MCRNPCPTQPSPLWPFIAPSHVQVVKKRSGSGTTSFGSKSFLFLVLADSPKFYQRKARLKMPANSLGCASYTPAARVFPADAAIIDKVWPHCGIELRVSSFLGCSSRYQQNGAPLLRCVHSTLDNRWPQCHLGDRMAIFIQGHMATTTDCLSPDLRLSLVTGKIQLGGLSRLRWCTSNTENQARQTDLWKNLKKGSQINQKSDKQKLWEETEWTQTLKYEMVA